MTNGTQTLLEFLLLIIVCVVAIWIGMKVLAYIAGISAFVAVPIQYRKRAQAED